MKACRRSQWEDVRFVQHGSFPPSIRETKLHVPILYPKYKKSCLPAKTIIIIIYLFKVDEIAKTLHGQKIYIKLIIIIYCWQKMFYLALGKANWSQPKIEKSYIYIKA